MPDYISRMRLVIFMLCTILFACVKSVNKIEVQGEVKISYTLNAWDHPTVIWLEDKHKNYLKTIYVSDWLSNDGYLLSYVCPQWSKVANWSKVPELEIDAVTSATPAIGRHEIILNCNAADLSYGIYYYSVETHIQNKYNIVYTGKITISDVANSSVAEVIYLPEAHPDSAKRNVLSDVEAKYQLLN